MPLGVRNRHHSHSADSRVEHGTAIKNYYLEEINLGWVCGGPRWSVRTMNVYESTSANNTDFGVVEWVKNNTLR